MKAETGKDGLTYPILLHAKASATGAPVLPEWLGIMPVQQEEERGNIVTNYQWISLLDLI